MRTERTSLHGGRSARWQHQAKGRRRAQDETGTGIVGTYFGATMFLILLLFGVQVIVHLYAVSTLTSVTFAAAQAVANSPGDQVAEEAVAEGQARSRLGSLGSSSHTRFVWEEADGNQVVLRVESESPSFLPLPASYREISRTVTVRTERFR